MQEAVRIDGKQYVVFKLENEEYGLDIHKVISIERMKTISRVPKTPAYIKGVINLRGEIIPIMDLRARFNITGTEETEETRIIIIKIEDASLGVIVDAVVEVLELPEEAIENVASFSNDISMEYIQGAGKIEDRIVTLLNLDKLANI